MTAPTPPALAPADQLSALLLDESCGVVLVDGPVGAGKSHILRMLAHRLRRHPVARRRALITAGPACVPRSDDLTDGHPIVLADDLDRWPADVLGQLSAAVDEAGVQLIAGVRSRALPSVLAEFRPARTPVVVRLPPCSPAALQAYAHRMLGGPLHAATAQRLVTYAGGNPLCLHELLHEGQRRGRLRERDNVWWWEGPIPLPPVTRARIWQELLDVPPSVRDVTVSLAGAQRATPERLPLADLVAVHSPEALNTAEELDLIATDQADGEPMAMLRRPLEGWVVLACSPTRERREILTRTATRLLAGDPPRRGAALLAARLLHRAKGTIPAEVRRGAVLDALSAHDPIEAAEFGHEAGRRPARATPDDLVAALQTASRTGQGLSVAYARGVARLPHCDDRAREQLLPALAWVALQEGRIQWCLDAAEVYGDRIEHFEATSWLAARGATGLARLLAGDLDGAEAAGADLARTGANRQWPLANAVGEFLLGRCALDRGLIPTARQRFTDSAISCAGMARDIALPGLIEAALALAEARATPGAAFSAPGIPATAPPLLSVWARITWAEAQLARNHARLAETEAQRILAVSRDAGQPLAWMLAAQLAGRCWPGAGTGAVLRSAARQVDGALASVLEEQGAAWVSGDPARLAETATRYARLGLSWLAAEAAAAALARCGTQHPGWAMACRELIDEVRHRADTRVPAWWGRSADRVYALTAREEEVAKAASSGHTSRQIAAELGVSCRTVENHLHNAFRKLGITARTQLPTALADLAPVY